MKVTVLGLNAALALLLAFIIQVSTVAADEFTTITIVAPIQGASEPEYHWWDVVTDRAQEFFGPKIDRASELLSDGRDNAVEAGEQAINDAAEYGQQAKDDVDDLGMKAKTKAYNMGQMLKQGASRLGMGAKDNVERIKQDIQNGAESLDQRINEDVSMARQKAANDISDAKLRAHHVTKRVKHGSEDAYDALNVDGQKLAGDAQQAAQEARDEGARLFGGIRSRIGEKIAALSAFTSGSGSQLRSDLSAGVDRLREFVRASTENGTPTWPEKIFDNSQDSVFADYIRDLSQASQQAHSLVGSKLDLHSELLEKIARSQIALRLPLASAYGPVIALVLVYLISSVWIRRADLRGRSVQSETAASIGVETTRAFQQEYMAVSDAITMTCTYLAIIPMTAVLLVIMEINGLAGWLISCSYTCLLAGSVAAAQPSLLALVAPGGSSATAGQRLTIGIATFVSVCCLVNSVVGH
ncbi:hypothetical protein GGI07_003768 [Coemansia sp. Benny D115]|nr:hypothetical protein GGI07_003768 [Coemansia sp. Benny D115]